MKTLVVGLGNPILTDDGVGIYVARALAARGLPRGVEVAEASLGGLRLLDIMQGYERVVLVDAIQTVDGRPGQLYRLGPNDLWVSRHAGSSHDMALPTALALGRQMGMVLPADENLTIVAVEVAEVLDFGERCTPEVEAAIPRAVEEVLDLLEERCTNSR